MKALLTTAMLAALLLPATASAQVVRSYSSCGWLGISFDRASGTMAVRAVDNPSPAQRAGVVAGDTVTRINGAAAVRDGYVRTPIINVGDTVRMTVRRANSEREVRMVAERRPEGCFVQSIIIDADSIRRLMRVYIDSSLAILDTLRLPRVRIETGDEGMFFSRPDGKGGFRVDTLRMGGNLRMFGDDSLRVFGDSARARMYRAFGELPNEPFTFHWVDMGARSVAGAEFSELTPELAAGLRLTAREGLLVLKVAPNTPAAKAGIEPGDVITHARGEPVRTVAELRAAVARDRTQPAQLDVLRQGQRREVRLQR